MITRHHKKLHRCGLVLIFILLVAAGCSNDNDPTNTFPQPEERRSTNGILATTLTAAVTHNVIWDATTETFAVVETPNYENSLIGPTLRLQPGDTLSIDLINSLPLNPTQQRMGAFPHDPYTTNLHTHGLVVSPAGIADNVFRLMEPETSHLVEIAIPADHECGTFWYHPHKHGTVAFQFFGGMSGLLIIEGCQDGLDTIPEVTAAKDYVMAFQAIRADENGQVPFVNLDATEFSGSETGLWSTFTDSQLFITTNGVTSPVLHMRPGEVQRWRLLNAASGLTMIVALEDHSLNIIANDGITIPEMQTLDINQPYALGAGNRVDVLIQAGEPGTYLLQALDPTQNPVSVSPSGIDPAIRTARIGLDFPDPTYPITLATIVVKGDAKDMSLPEGVPLAAARVPSTETVLNTSPDAVRRIAFELCGERALQADPTHQLPSCGWYFEQYDADYWGGLPFTNLLMMRDADDTGVANSVDDPEMPRIDYQKEGLFAHGQPLFDDMQAGNFEQWTIINRSFSDHPFHIHTNPFLLTHINGTALSTPEWRDTILVPAATGGNGNINDATFGTVTFRTWFDPRFTGSMVMHCHILTHEDVGMMQQLDILPVPWE